MAVNCSLEVKTSQFTGQDDVSFALVNQVVYVSPPTVMRLPVEKSYSSHQANSLTITLTDGSHVTIDHSNEAVIQSCFYEYVLAICVYNNYCG